METALLLDQKPPDERGFTLIELLVVMVIIGLLLAAALPVFLAQKNRAKEAAVKADVKQLATQVESALVDGPGVNFQLTGLSGKEYTLSYGSGADAGSVVGTLSAADAASVSVDDAAATHHYCVTVSSSDSRVASWQVADENLSKGDCSDPATNAGAGVAVGSTS